MTLWDGYQFAARIREMLADTTTQPWHHLARSFMTPYQTAIEFERRFPDTVQEIGLPIGGDGTGQRSSLAQYIGRELSPCIQRGDLPDFEGAFLSSRHLSELAFRHDGRRIVPSLTSAQFDVSVYRLRPECV